MEYLIKNTTLTAIADEVRTLSGDTENLTTARMTTELRGANANVDEQTDLIARIKAALEDKAAGGGGEAKPHALSLIRNGIGYIDTGINGANSNLTIQVQYEFETMPTGYWYLIRAYANESTNATRILYNGTASIYCCLNSIPSSSLAVTQTRYAGVVYTDILKPENSTTFSYTTNGVKATKTRTSGTTLSGSNLLLFSNSTSSDGVVVKIYYLKIYDGDTLVRDFVPFVTQNGECGLYDNVTKQFFGNTGSGTFEADVINVGTGNGGVEACTVVINTLRNGNSNERIIGYSYTAIENGEMVAKYYHSAEGVNNIDSVSCANVVCGSTITVMLKGNVHLWAFDDDEGLVESCQYWYTSLASVAIISAPTIAGSSSVITFDYID